MCCHGSPPNTVGMYLGALYFLCLPSVLGNPAVRHRMLFSTMAAVKSLVHYEGTTHTGREGKLIGDDNSVQRLSSYVTFPSYWLEC